MKKTIFLLLFVAVCMSCTKGAGSASSAASTAAGNAVAEDSQAADVDDFTTSDLKAYFLHGHVKSVKSYGPEGEFPPVLLSDVSFTQDGELIPGDQENFERDANGRLTTVTIEPWEEYYEYNSDGTLKSWATMRGSSTASYDFQLNAEGMPISADYEGDSHGNGVNGRCVYTILDSDEKGNWTKIKVKSTVTTTDWEGNPGTTETRTDVCVRKITYY